MGTDAQAHKRRLVTLLLIATAMVAAIALTPMAAKAVHTEGLFELDGNIADSSLAGGQDWSAFQGPVAPGDTAPISTAFISDGFNGVNDTIYFGGGSQNNNDISDWAWSCGSVSTKSDIEHAFASAYIKNSQLFLYFGADRFDPTGGTTNVGFWFLQSGGALEGGSGCPDADPTTNTFSGQHVDGDLFVFAEFTGGGGDSAVSIYEWLSGGLHLLAAKSSGSFCSADDSICAQTNSETIDSTWAYSDNQGSSADGHILEGGFVEGGINLSSIYSGLGKELPCVNRFLAQTGSSHPDTGVLEDFAGGSFNVCSKLIVDKVAPSGDQTSFPFSVSGPSGYADVFQLADADAPHDSGQIKSGSYQVTETPGDASVWNAPSVACEDQGSNDVGYGANGAVDIAPGATVTCTFTNTKRPQLTVVKKIVGGNGSTDAFDVKVDGATKLDDAASTAPAGTSSGAFPVSAGNHTVSETLADGTTAVSPSDWLVSFSGDCDAGGEVSVQNDESKSCTVTNSKLPRLEVVKQIIGGDGSSFDIFVGATKVLDDAGDGATDTRTYAPGSYVVSETLGSGDAIPGGWSTSFSSGCPEAAVTLDYGDDKTCTITNSKLPILNVIKNVVGGAKSPSDFDISVSGNTPSPSSFPGSAGGTVVTLLPGGYDVSEDEDPHYTATYSAECKDGEITYGESKTCTITNTRKPSGVTIEKVASPTSVPEPGGPVTFTFTVRNTSPADTVTLTELTDSVYGDLFDRGNCDALENAQLAPADGGAGGPDEATCSFVATVSGNVGDPHHNVATVTGHDEDDRAVADDDFADVEITDVAPSIEVTKTANPETVPEPGGPVEFTVQVENTSVSTDPVTITSLVDDPDGDGPAGPIDLDGMGSCSVPQTIQPGGTYTCKFTRTVSGNAGDVKTDVVTASGRDDDGHEVSDHDDATVRLTDLQSSIALEKTASPTSMPAPGGQVTFTVVVKNTSAVDSVTIDKLDDNVYGDLAVKGTCGALIGKVLQPDDHAAGGPDEASCTFTASVTGPGGSTHTDVVTATGHDDDQQPLTAHDDATVAITPLIDLFVTKEDLPDPVQLNGRLTYTIVVGNNGPDAATEVTLADPLPAGTSFVSVSTTQGSCTGGALISCNLGTIAKGGTVTITLVVTAQQSGVVTNTVTVVGKEPESNTANNRAIATTRVPAPAVKRTPKRVVCDTVTAGPKSLSVGRRGTIVVRVRAAGKPVKGRKVVVKGAGILKTGRTNAKGVARIVVRPRRAGIVTITVPQKIACGAKRIGVVGAFQPPVTG